jgi:hypothetical protein
MPAAIAEDSVLGRINALLAEVGGEKRAAAKKRATEMGLSGSGADDPGGRSGPSTHPTARADSDTGEAPLGARGKENEEDVKEDRPAAVDAQGAGEGGGQDDHQTHIGTNPKATGEDPSVEDDYDHSQSDPGTEHPADASKEKTAADRYASLPVGRHVKVAFEKIHDVLAEIGGGKNVEKKAGAEKADDKGRPALKAAAAAGRAAGEQALAGRDKRAAAAAVLEEAILEAHRDADNVAAFLRDHRQALRKQAARTKRAEGGPGMPPPPPGMEGGMPPGAGPQEGAIPPEAYGGEGGGAPPGGGVGGMGGEEGGGGGGDRQAALEELANALMEAGIHPEEIVEAARQAAPPEGGGAPPPEAGGAPPPEGGGDDKQAAARRREARPDERRARLTKMAASMRRRPDDAADLARLSGDVIDARERGELKIKAARTSEQRRERDEVMHWARAICGGR